MITHYVSLLLALCQSRGAMTRVDTQSTPRSVFISNASKIYEFCHFIAFIAVVLTCVVAYFSFTSKSFLNLSGNLHYNIREVYNAPEALDPEDRDVFAGFKTSFLPEEEVMLAQRQHVSSRIKRMCRLPFLSYQYEDLIKKHNEEIEDDEDDIDNYDEFEDDNDNEGIEHESQMSEDENSENDSDQYDNNDGIESVVTPETHVDRGPLDDVVEQIRGQPELEEGEMGSSAHNFKPARSHTVIHAFWKGQGDKHEIRKTQANIMKQYMDPEADPCHDFYQYACGNWAGLNPIPADKAGYDTFEMLRENLDTVLKDLLEFKANENVRSEFPGKHLIINEIYLFNHFLNKNIRVSHAVAEDNSPDIVNRTLMRIAYMQQNMNISNSYQVNNKAKKRNRMRRFPHRPLNDTRESILRYRQKMQINKEDDSKHRQFIERFRVNSPHKKSYFGKKLPQKIRPINHSRKLLNHFVHTNDKPKREKSIIPVKRKCKKKIVDPAKGNAALKARFLFKSCMNYNILERRGHQPLLDLLQLLGGWPILDPHWDSISFDWLQLMAELRLYNNDILLSEWVGPDIKNSNEFVIQFDQTSLGLPTRDYFLQANNKPYLDAYKKYLLTIALLLGGDTEHVHNSADKLIQFEIRLAKITSAPEDRRNVTELYRRMPLHKLNILVPEVDWTRYLCIVMNRTVEAHETVVLFALPYVRNLVKLIDETEKDVLSNYLLWRFVRHRVNNLDDRFQIAKQQFYYVLFGREQAPPRWKNCISQVNSNMGMALGSMFVRKYFDETSKNDTLTMTREIQQSFREILHKTEWIDNETKRLAAQKVDAIMLRIGYPDFILKTSDLDDRYIEVIVHPDKYFENILNILQHLTKMEQSRIGQPVNKTLWNTAPAVVNAYYSRNKNQIMFPAGILQPPFYHRHFPRSLNYGGIGVVIGHEITHGFDDKGRLFDCDGNLHRWWSDIAIEHFHQRAQGLIDQYGKYVVPEVNMKLDGVNTQGENIADNGGVKQAFRSYLRWLKKHGSDNETLPGLNHTHTQLFFLNFAQVWCGAMRPEAMRNKLKTAVHSPGRFRVIGTLSNSHDFAREFNCPVGSQMNPAVKYSVW